LIDAALDELEARFREHERLVSPTLDHILAGGHLLLMTNCGPLDVLGFIGKGKRYEELAESSVTIAVGDLSVRVLDLAALIDEKRALGRDKDRAVIALLEAVLKHQRGG
jgi:hypothetical protein